MSYDPAAGVAALANGCSVRGESVVQVGRGEPPPPAHMPIGSQLSGPVTPLSHFLHKQSNLSAANVLRARKKKP